VGCFDVREGRYVPRVLRAHDVSEGERLFVVRRVFLQMCGTDSFTRRTLDAEQRVRSALRELDRLGAPAQLPTRRHASDASLRARLRAGLDAGQRQREEIARLREELAVAHGRARELELDRRVRRA
jgi:hypothetical protein